MKIKPTTQMIESDKHSAWNCPYAQAIIAACPSLNKNQIMVTNLTIRIGTSVIFTPPEMADWIEAYDRADRLMGYPKKQIPPLRPAPEVDLPLEEFCT